MTMKAQQPPTWWERMQARHQQLIALLQAEPLPLYPSGKVIINATALLLTVRTYGKTYHDKRFLADELKLIAAELEE